MKGQMKQIFIYIMTIVIIGFILLVALQSWDKINRGACDADKVQFKRALLADLAENQYAGRESVKEYGAPCDFQMLCLADARAVENGEEPLQFANLGADVPYELGDEDQKKLIANSVAEGIRTNIWIVKNGVVEPVEYYDKLHLSLEACTGDCIASGGGEDIPKYVFCTRKKGGEFTFTLLGQGRSIMVKP